jgi:hypothetical protein
MTFIRGKSKISRPSGPARYEKFRLSAPCGSVVLAELVTCLRLAGGWLCHNCQQLPNFGNGIMIEEVRMFSRNKNLKYRIEWEK